MKVSKEQVRENRTRIVETASKLFVNAVLTAWALQN